MLLLGIKTNLETVLQFFLSHSNLGSVLRPLLFVGFKTLKF